MSKQEIDDNPVNEVAGNVPQDPPEHPGSSRTCICCTTLGPLPILDDPAPTLPMTDSDRERIRAWYSKVSQAGGR